MSQERLNGLATLSIEKRFLDEIDSNTITNEFASRNARRNFKGICTFMNCCIWILLLHALLSIYNL
jgi:hypothetical protein